MSSDFGSDLITISDDDGNVFVLEHLDTIEIDGIYYAAFLPADLDEDDDDYGMIILRAIEEDGVESFISVDDEHICKDLHERFLERLLDDDEL